MMCEYSPAKKVVNASVSVVQESPVGLIGLDLWAILRWPSNLDGLIHRQAVCENVIVCQRERKTEQPQCRSELFLTMTSSTSHHVRLQSKTDYSSQA